MHKGQISINKREKSKIFFSFYNVMINKMSYLLLSLTSYLSNIMVPTTQPLSQMKSQEGFI